MQSATIDGVSITNDFYWPTKLGKGFMPEIEQSTYTLGNRDGVALSTPYYRNLSIIMEILVRGTSMSDLVVKRNNLIKLFRLNANRSNKTRTLRIVDNAGYAKSINFITQSVSSDDLPERKNYAVVTVGLQGDKEYYSSDSKSNTVYISTGGGFSIPFGLPFDMSVGAINKFVELTNSGNTESYPTMRVYGDMAGFNIVNSDTGQTFTCTETLGVNDYIDFDFYRRTAVKNSITNVLNTITSDSADWIYLSPGANKINLSSVTTSDVARGEITYHDAYLNL